MTKRNPSQSYQVARELAKKLAAMDPAERDALAANIMAPVTIEGHVLSLRNALLIFTQRQAGATVVGGFKQWLKSSRVVRKGESALWIYAPSIRKVQTEDGGEDQEMRFRLVPVFDVAQTAELAQDQAAA